MGCQKKYYDPDSECILYEQVVKERYERMKKYPWYQKSYKEFLAENFLNEDMTKISFD